MLKACIVIQNHLSAVMGGAQYQSHLLAEELARHEGVSVTYLARGICADRCARMQIPYQVKRIGRQTDARDRSAFLDAIALRKALAELQPDVIYQQMRDSYTAVCARYAQAAGVPFFFHIASDADLDARWLPLRLSSRLPQELIEGTAGKWGLLHARYIIAQTERQSRVLRQRFGRDDAVIIRNFQPMPASLPVKPSGPVRVFWVANLKAVKRPEIFVQLAESFVGRDDIQFLMAGRPATMRRLAPLMSRLHAIANLKYLGEVPIEEVNRLMDEADIHINTSRYEGFPNTFIQAWARGAVVVSVGVDPDEGMDRMGIGFCTRDLQELRGVVDRLAREPQQRREIAQRAFAFVTAQHSMTNATALAQLMIKEGRAGLDARAGDRSIRHA